MTKKDWFGIGYVSVWIVIWGTIGSLVDLPFLKSGTYSEGSLGQVTTFTVCGVLSIIIGVWLFPIISKSKLLVAALGLDIEDKN